MDKSNIQKASPELSAIRTLGIRMIYYPIVQCVGRSGWGWYAHEYGTIGDTTTKNPTMLASLYYLALITPVISIGYLTIFLVMQPAVWRHFRNLLRACLDPNIVPVERGDRCQS